MPSVAKYEYVAVSIDLNNRICEEYGVPLQIKYFNQLQTFPENLLMKDLLFTIEDEETVAKFDLFKGYGINYLIQIEKFLVVNHQLMVLLETYIKENE